MVPNQVSVRAKFNGKDLFVIDHSPEIPGPSGEPSLLWYVTSLIQDGWRVVQGRFDGWEVLLTLEQHAEVPSQTVSYMIPMFHQLALPEGLSSAANHHRQMMDKLLEISKEEGWSVLTPPKHLAVDGLWTISIWVKNYENLSS